MHFRYEVMFLRAIFLYCTECFSKPQLSQKSSIDNALSARTLAPSPRGGGGGALTLVLGTHCKTDSRSCGCRLEKGGLSRTQELSGGGLSEGHFLLGL